MSIHSHSQNEDRVVGSGQVGLGLGVLVQVQDKRVVLVPLVKEKCKQNEPVLVTFARVIVDIGIVIEGWGVVGV